MGQCLTSTRRLASVALNLQKSACGCTLSHRCMTSLRTRPELNRYAVLHLVTPRWQTHPCESGRCPGDAACAEDSEKTNRFGLFLKPG
eukprot:1271343-Amphidinium_carterae.1